jgi:hypothetical protein
VSDSTKQDEHFNSRKFAKALCANKKIYVSAANCNFRQGWAPIFERFIENVGKYPMMIHIVTDKHDFMEIEVDMGSTTRAKYIYHEILIAKHHSMQICAHCGDKKYDNDNKFCKGCTANAAKLKTTGTWLDSFERSRHG